MQRLELTCGNWAGTGTGGCSTVESFEYEDRLRFEVDPSYSLIQYEQRTLLLPSREPSHWECGFIRPFEDGHVELLNAQGGDRVEVLRGPLDPSGRMDELTITLDSVVLAHDPRLVRSRRELAVRGDTLHYVAHMATHTTPQPELIRHLEARLRRVDAP